MRTLRARQEPEGAEDVHFGAGDFEFAADPCQLCNETVAFATKVSNVVVERGNEQIHLGVATFGVAAEPEDLVPDVLPIAVERERLDGHPDCPVPWIRGEPGGATI